MLGIGWTGCVLKPGDVPTIVIMIINRAELVKVGYLKTYCFSLTSTRRKPRLWSWRQTPNACNEIRRPFQAYHLGKAVPEGCVIDPRVTTGGPTPVARTGTWPSIQRYSCKAYRRSGHSLLCKHIRGKDGWYIVPANFGTTSTKSTPSLVRSPPIEQWRPLLSLVEDLLAGRVKVNAPFLTLEVVQSEPGKLLATGHAGPHDVSVIQELSNDQTETGKLPQLANHIRAEQHQSRLLYELLNPEAGDCCHRTQR